MILNNPHIFLFTSKKLLDIIANVVKKHSLSVAAPLSEPFVVPELYSIEVQRGKSANGLDLVIHSHYILQ